MSFLFLILLALWLVTFAANLIHWHGSGRLYYPSASTGSKVVGLSIVVAGILFLILRSLHAISAGMIVMDFFFALLAIQHIGMIVRRRHDRGQRHEATSA